MTLALNMSDRMQSMYKAGHKRSCHKNYLIIEAMRPRRSDAGEGYYQHVILTFDSLLLQIAFYLQ